MVVSPNAALPCCDPAPLGRDAPLGSTSITTR
jgi:hypothetical protein